MSYARVTMRVRSETRAVSVTFFLSKPNWNRSVLANLSKLSIIRFHENWLRFSRQTDRLADMANRPYMNTFTANAPILVIVNIMRKRPLRYCPDVCCVWIYLLGVNTEHGRWLVSIPGSHLECPGVICLSVATPTTIFMVLLSTFSRDAG
jgi:hypothetical protein